MHARHARPEDAADMARIYSQGIADRTATFETRPRTESDIRAWFDGAHPLLVVEQEGAAAAFAATFAYGPGVLLYIGTLKGRLRWDAWRLKLPLLGDALRKAETSRFARAMATLIGNTVPLVQAIGISAAVLNNRYI